MKTLQEKKFTLLLQFVLLCIFISGVANAQLRPVNAIYYFNDFIMNPSMAGREQQLIASVGYRKQFSSLPKSPTSQFLTAEYGFNEKSGVGLKIYNEKAGLLRQTMLSAGYAFHLPLSKENKLHFGITGTIADFNLDMNNINGDFDDVDITAFNQRKPNIDSDFGIAFTGTKLTVQVGVPNMVAAFKKSRADETNYPLFFTSLGYHINTSIGDVEPKLVYRGIKGFDNIFDMGANLSFDSRTTQKLNLLAVYHSSKNVSMGFGITNSKNLSLTSSFTTGSSEIRGYSKGDLEIAVKVEY